MLRNYYYLPLFVLLAIATSDCFAGRTGKLHGGPIPVIQALRSAHVNTLSNIEFWQTNYGELFLNVSVANGVAGTFWPRGSSFSYIFGGGMWFGAVKDNTHHVLVGYNPYSGGSWFQPGSVASAKAFYDSVRNSPAGVGRYPRESDNSYGAKFPIFSSLDYDRSTGRPLNPALNLPNWPIWDTDTSSTAFVGSNHYFGNYVDDPAKRDTSFYPVRYITTVHPRFDTAQGKTVYDTVTSQKGGPAFVSEEDLFTVCNEMDTTYDLQKSPGRAYPLQTEVQRSIYTWGSVHNKDFIFVVYKIINNSSTTLDSCYLANVVDADVGTALNDECGFYQKDTTLNLAMQWSDKESNVPGAQNSFAYPGVIGFDFLESPAVYHTGEVPANLVGTIKPGVHPNSEQLGLVRFKRWGIGTDPTDDDTRYDFMTTHVRDTALNQFDDKRILMSTGPFRLLPNQSAQIAVGLDIARDSINGDDNLQSNIDACVALDKEAQIVYDNSYAVTNPSLPPSSPTFRAVVAGNHSVLVHWDSLADYSFDPFVGNLDFMGYRLYRGRGTRPQDFKVIKEWKLTDLDPATYQSLRGQLPGDQQPASVRGQFYNAVHHYMDSLTNHYSYFDNGDDNHDGVVRDSEQLLNFVDYVYWIAAFDQGDTARGIPSQQTNIVPGQSMIRVQPFSADNSSDTDYVMSLPQNILGGISQFHWIIQNQKIVSQLLAGDTVHVEFMPSVGPPAGNNPTYAGINWYSLSTRIWDSRSQFDVMYPYDVLHTFPAMYSSIVGSSNVFPIDTTLLQTTSFGLSGITVPVVPATGGLNSGDTSFTPNQALLNTLTHRMSYQFLQVCGQLRYPVSFAPTVQVTDTIITHQASGANVVTYQTRTYSDTVWQSQWSLQPYGLTLAKQGPTAQRQPLVTAVYALNDSQVIHHPQYTADTVDTGLDPFGVVSGPDTVSMYWDNSGNPAFDSTANLGQYDYIVQFSAGGTEYDTISTIPYAIPYLNVTVQGQQSYTVPATSGGDSTVRIIQTLTAYDNTDNVGAELPAANWTMDPLLWKTSPSNNADVGRSKQYLGFPLSKVASPNRYYLTGHGTQTDSLTLVVVNRLTLGGNKIYLDSANKTTNRFTHTSLPGNFNKPSHHDMRPGDALRVTYTGGMLGLPWPNASFITVFKGTPNDVQERGSIGVPTSALANVRLWPNPIVMGNDNLVFDQLPEQCTIALYNLAGDCIGTINHTSGTQESYDLVRDGKQRIATQLLIATIRTAGGESRSMRVVALGK